MAKSHSHEAAPTQSSQVSALSTRQSGAQEPKGRSGPDGYAIALVVWLLGFIALLVWLLVDLVLGLI